MIDAGPQAGCEDRGEMVAAAFAAAIILRGPKKAARLSEESGRYGSTQYRVIKGSRGTRYRCQNTSPAIV